MAAAKVAKALLFCWEEFPGIDELDDEDDEDEDEDDEVEFTEPRIS